MATLAMLFSIFSNPSGERERAAHLGQLLTIPLSEDAAQPTSAPSSPTQPIKKPVAPSVTPAAPPKAPAKTPASSDKPSSVIKKTDPAPSSVVQTSSSSPKEILSVAEHLQKALAAQEKLTDPAGLLGAGGAKKGASAAAPRSKIKPKISILIAGLGLEKDSTDLALQLPAEVAFGFSPYGAFTPEYSQKIMDQGHELYMHLPMELAAGERADVGPFALRTGVSTQENIQRLDYMLSKAPGGLSGVYILGNQVFSSAMEQAEAILNELRRKNILLVVGDLEAADFTGLARSMQIPIGVSSMWLDDELSEDAVRTKLQSLPDLALAHEGILVFAHPYPMTITLLQQWMDDIAEHAQVAIAPISVLITHKKDSSFVQSPLQNNTQIKGSA
jgi:polysaccharide deacetylase 2 family uncharacterized protein YibQ